MDDCKRIMKFLGKCYAIHRVPYVLQVDHDVADSAKRYSNLLMNRDPQTWELPAENIVKQIDTLYLQLRFLVGHIHAVPEPKKLRDMFSNEFHALWEIYVNPYMNTFKIIIIPVGFFQ